MRSWVIVALCLVILLLLIALFGQPVVAAVLPKIGGRENPLHRWKPPRTDHFPPRITKLSKLIPGSIDYSLFDTTKESFYSSLMPSQLVQVNNVLKVAAPNVRSLIDATAHIGVDSANFMKVYPDAIVTSVEVNPATFHLLRRNLGRVSRHLRRPGSRSVVLNENGVDYLRSRPANAADVVYLDPPWGGPGFKELKYADITLTDAAGKKWDMPTLIADVLDRKVAKLVLLKIPPNYPLSKLPPAAKLYPINVNTRTVYYLVAIGAA